jgi:hypothetical protein
MLQKKMTFPVWKGAETAHAGASGRREGTPEREGLVFFDLLLEQAQLLDDVVDAPFQ